jgi:hypothetical protein
LFKNVLKWVLKIYFYFLNSPINPLNPPPLQLFQGIFAWQHGMAQIVKFSGWEGGYKQKLAQKTTIPLVKAHDPHCYFI